MPVRSYNRIAAALGAVSFVGLVLPMPQGGAIGQERVAEATGGGAGISTEITLPFEMQNSFFHSLPIAGHIVTPDQVAERVMTNPRLRVATGMPYSGKGTANPIHQSGVVDTHADPLRNSHRVRGVDRAPKP